MSTNQVTVHGQVKPDGTLEVTERVDLTARAVQVTVEPTPKVPAGEDTRLVLGRIWARREARGAVARSKEEMTPISPPCATRTRAGCVRLRLWSTATPQEGVADVLIFLTATLSST